MSGEVRLGIIVPSVEEWYPKVVPDGQHTFCPQC